MEKQPKSVSMSNPAISALANDLKNCAQQYQQQVQAAANAAAAATAAANASSRANANTVNFSNNQGAILTNNHQSNARLLSLLNRNSSAPALNPILNQLLNNVISPANKQQIGSKRHHITDITDSVSFKAYLKRGRQEVEVRRFGVDGRGVSSHMYLRSKIQAMFPSIQSDQFQVYWQDNDKDYIKLDSDEELLEALTSSNQRPLKLYIQVQNNNAQGGSTSSSVGDRHTHPGVVCNCCEGSVVGFRYMCVTCPDYDLCNRCENKGHHSEHFMLRLPTPIDSFCHHPKLIRKLLSRPHKFHKRHAWSQPATPSRGCGDSQNGARWYPFSRQRAGPRNPATFLSGVTDTFDFSALMDFIESLGTATSEDATNLNANTGSTPTTNGASQNPNQVPSMFQN